MKSLYFKMYFFQAFLSFFLLIACILPGYTMNEEHKRPRTAKKTLPLVNNTFQINEKTVNIPLPYVYSKVDPETTRCFFEGEVVMIGPESPFESYVTYPLLPCLLGRIYDPESKKSLAFHKGAIHGMDSLKPFYQKLEVSDPNKLEVSLYSCELSKEQFKQNHARYYGQKNQSQEMIAVRNFLTQEFCIPKENIELRFYKKAFTLPDLGPYYAMHLTVGIKKTGELFHTAFLAEDVFNLKEVKNVGQKKEQYPKFSTLPFEQQRDVVFNFAGRILLPNVRERFVGTPELIDRSRYGDLKFFLTEELDIPASSFPKKFRIKIRDDEIEVIEPLFSNF